MIFATCGSSHFRFDRMMQALAALSSEQLCVQHGPAEPPPCVSAYAYLPFDKIVENIERADVVVSHAGVGSILCAVQAGHTPVIFPRLKRYSETVDDHQAEFAEALASRGVAVVARTSSELLAAIATVPKRRADASSGSRPLVDAVRMTILGAPLVSDRDAVLPVGAGRT